MDWIKIKVSHIDYDFEGVDMRVCWGWIRVMSMTAALERIPTEQQIEARIGKKTLADLKIHLQTTGTTLDIVLAKVMEDVTHVKNRKEHDRKYMSKYRCKTLHNGLQDTLHDDDVNGKRREDKRRKDTLSLDSVSSQINNDIDMNKDHINNNNSNNIGKWFEDFWSKYPRPVGVSQAFLTYKATVKCKSSASQVLKALENYKASDEFKKGFIKNGDKWLEDWRGWLVIEPKSKDPLSKWEVKK